LKIISFYSNEKQLLKKAVSGNRDAQRTIYEKFAPKMLSVCRQYIKDVHFAEDVMVNGFVKVFKNLNAFEHTKNASRKFKIKRGFTKIEV